MAVTVDESPNITQEPSLQACIKIDDVIVVKCTTHWIDQLTNSYTSSQIDVFETNVITHIEALGYRITPRLKSDIKDSIAYIGTLG